MTCIHVMDFSWRINRVWCKNKSETRIKEILFINLMQLTLKLPQWGCDCYFRRRRERVNVRFLILIETPSL